MAGKDNAASSKMHPVHEELRRTPDQRGMVMILDGRGKI